MPIDFDDVDMSDDDGAYEEPTEYAPPPPSRQQQRRRPAPQPQYDYEEEEEQYAPEPEPLDPLQERLAVAGCYNALLQRGVFEDGSLGSDIVEREVQDFVKQRLAELVGYKTSEPRLSEVVKSPFDDEEVGILKEFVQRIKDKNRDQKPVEPQVKKPEPAKPPTIKKQRVKKQPVPPPPVRTQAPPPPKQPAPQPRKPLVRPQPKSPLRAQAPVQQIKDPADDPRLSGLADEVEFTWKGKKWKWKTNELGTRFKVDLTGQYGATPGPSGNTKMLPMPVGNDFATLSAFQAARQVQQAQSSIAASSPRLAAAIITSQSGEED